jgi:predicted metalloprotease
MKFFWSAVFLFLFSSTGLAGDILRLPKDMTLLVGVNTQVMDGDIELNLTGIPIPIEDPSTYREYQDLDMLTTVLADVDLFLHMDKIPAFILRSKGLRNAFAGVYDHLRIVVFDPDYIWDMNDWESAKAIRAFVFAHEFGHHYCGHIESGPSPAHELEADQFAGALIKKAQVPDVSFNLRQVGRFLPAAASATHPGSADRLQAIYYGYTNGSPCMGRAITKRVQR